MKKIIILLLLLISTSAFAQGEYLGHGYSGIEGGIGYFQTKPWLRTQDNFTPYLAYSYKGMFDIGASMIIERMHSNDKHSTNFGIGFHLVNDDSKFLNLAFTSSGHFDVGLENVSYNVFVSKNIRIIENIYIQPSASTGYNKWFKYNNKNTFRQHSVGFALFTKFNGFIISAKSNYSVIEMYGRNVDEVFFTISFLIGNIKKPVKKPQPINESNQEEKKEDEKPKVKPKMKKYYGG